MERIKGLLILVVLLQAFSAAAYSEVGADFLKAVRLGEDVTLAKQRLAEIPWEALAVKLMLKWPNLYYSTSAFAPKHYPKAIIEYANTRGSDKIIYAGYFPMGLSLDRIFSDMENVPFKDEVWPKFLRENAKRLFKL